MDRGINLYLYRSIDIDVGIAMEIAIHTVIQIDTELGINRSIGMPIEVQKQLQVGFIGMLA